MKGLLFEADLQQARPAAWCACCAQEVYAGEELYEWEGAEICLECFQDKVERLLARNPAQLALELGLRVERAG